MKYKNIINQISLDEKVAFCSGKGFFSTKQFTKYAIPGIQVADGPHGLRKQLDGADYLDVNLSLPSTCFPTASLSACSWDRDLLREMGAAIAAEALQEGVSIVLGPGCQYQAQSAVREEFRVFFRRPVPGRRDGGCLDRRTAKPGGWRFAQALCRQQPGK